MQIDNRGDFEDVVKGMHKLGYKLWVRDGNTLLTTSASHSRGAVAHLPFDLPVDGNYQLDFDTLKQAMSALEGDSITAEKADESLVLSDDSREVAIRVYNYRGGPDIDPSNVDTSMSNGRLDIPYSDILSEVRSAERITGKDTVYFDADGRTLTLSSSGNITSYESELELESQTEPVESSYDVDVLSKASGLVPDDASLSMGDDTPIFIEGSFGDIETTVLLAPKIQET